MGEQFPCLAGVKEPQVLIEKKKGTKSVLSFSVGPDCIPAWAIPLWQRCDWFQYFIFGPWAVVFLHVTGTGFETRVIWQPCVGHR